MAKISINCGIRQRYPGGNLSDLPSVTHNKKLRDALFSAVSLAIEELGGNVDLLEFIGLSHHHYFNLCRSQVEVKISTLDPLKDSEHPHEQKATMESTRRIDETSMEAIKTQIVSQFWECIENRREMLKKIHISFPTRPTKQVA